LLTCCILTSISGIGLSGGQRARVALARAIYSRSPILLLDDPIAALDHNTAESIVRKCFSGPLIQDRVVVLATHRTSLVQHVANQFIHVSDGKIEVSSDSPFSGSGASTPPDQEDLKAQAEANEQKPIGGEGAGPSAFLEEERREQGGIKAKVWLAFLKAGKYWWIMLGVAMTLVRVLGVVQQWFFKSWGEAYGDSGMNVTTTFATPSGFLLQTIDGHPDWISPASNQVRASFSWDPVDYLPSPKENLRPWLICLVVVSTANSMALGLYACSQITAVYATGKNMFAHAMVQISKATFRYYDVTPAGRLMNRLTSDIQILDSALTYFGHTIFYVTGWISAVIVVASVSPLFLLLSMGLMSIFVVIFRHFLPTSRSLKRLETTSLSPLFTHFGELLQAQGLTTVRAFNAQHAFRDKTISILDQYQGIGHFYWSVQNWLLYRYENISAISTFTMTVLALAINLPPGLTAFMLLNASSFVTLTHALCTRFGDLQTEFISVERIVELMEVESEPRGKRKPPASWPSFGSDVVFEKATIRYAPNLDPSLNSISLHIPGGSMTAVIGRTGSGKSTLAAALLSIVRPDADGGTIQIGGESLEDLDVETLRQRVTFIPQDPVLFLGNVRQNLDPVEQFTDSECETVLRRVCAGSVEQDWTLDTHVESGGRNFSQGQRQLLGIARAVLRRSPVVILDEATASIDVETSMKLQQIVREELKDATVITIAHRVEAVKGADYCVVLENGKVVKQGPVEENLLVSTDQDS
jgi:ABC-type multidrug transport system fused ATPase/permease subunit